MTASSRKKLNRQAMKSAENSTPYDKTPHTVLAVPKPLGYHRGPAYTMYANQQKTTIFYSSAVLLVKPCTMVESEIIKSELELNSILTHGTLTI